MILMSKKSIPCKGMTRLALMIVGELLYTVVNLWYYFPRNELE